MTDSVDRRQFLRRAAAVLPLMHAGSLLAIPSWCAVPTTQTPAPPKPPARFARLRLRTQPMDEMERFYRDTLGLPIARDGSKLNVTAGETVIEFSPTPGVEPQDANPPKPYYHFAFNIPHNKLDAAMKWLESRCPLV